MCIRDSPDGGQGGTNTAPTAGSVDLGATNEDTAITFTAAELLANSSDTEGDTLSIAAVSVAASAGTITDNGGGTFTFIPAANFNGNNVEVSFTITDGELTDTASASLDVTAVNDAPTVAAALTAAATEDGAVVTLDLLDGADDVDNGAILSVSGLPDALPAGVTVEGTSLSFDPSDIAYQSLAQGEFETIIITYNVVDETGASTAQTATFNVTGTNDAPVASAQITAGGAINTGEFTLDLLDGASDIDGDTLSVESIFDLPDGVTLSGSTLTVDTNNAAFSGLGDGQTETIIVTFDVSDGQGGTTARTATLTVTGSNSTPVITAALTADLSEDSGVQTVDLLEGANDPDGDLLMVVNLSELPDEVTMDGTTLSVNTDAETFQSLAAGETRVITVTYDITVGNSEPVSQTATLRITVTNDAPTDGEALTRAANENC